MAGSTLTITTVTNTTATVTLTTSDWPDAKYMAASIPKNGGIFDDLGVFYPSSAILKVAIS